MPHDAETEIKRLQGICKMQAAEIKTLTKEKEKLRNALAPFACLGPSALRPRDFNRAYRTINRKE